MSCKLFPSSCLQIGGDAHSKRTNSRHKHTPSLLLAHIVKTWRGVLMTKEGFTLWFTGLSGAGKTTIAKLVEFLLQDKMKVRVQLLDGDLLREVINQDLGFSREDRMKQIKRAVFMTRLLNQNGVHVLASFITPYEEMREYCCSHIPNYHEVFVDCSLEECIQRDVKGLYKKAIAGQINQFTGISDPFEIPLEPDLILDTVTELPEESAEKVLSYILDKQLI